MKNLRIGLITADLSHKHGWAHYSLELARGLQAAGVRLKVVTAHNSTDHAGLDAYPILPALVPRERFLFPRLMACLPQTRKILHDCDLIHCTVEPFAPLGRWVAGSRPFFQGGVGSYLHIDQWQRWPLTTIYRRAMQQAHVVCISHYSERVAQAEFPGVTSDTIPLGIDPGRFANLPDLSQPKPPGPVILSSGGVKPRKGTLQLVRAVAKVREQMPDVQCVILGKVPDNAYTAQVRQAIAANQLEDCVHLVGFVSETDLLAWYGAADVFVLPSINEGWMFEGFGLVHMEASAAGLPVIGTTDCGVEDAVVDGVTGLLVPQDQVDAALPGAIIELLSDPEKRARMGAAGRQRAQMQTWERVIGEMVTLYQGALSGEDR